MRIQKVSELGKGLGESLRKVLANQYPPIIGDEEDFSDGKVEEIPLSPSLPSTEDQEDVDRDYIINNFLDSVKSNLHPEERKQVVEMLSSQYETIKGLQEAIDKCKNNISIL